MVKSINHCLTPPDNKKRMKTFVNNLDSHPLAAMVTAIIGIATGTALHILHPLLSATTTMSHDTVDLLVKYFQMFAYAGGGIAGFVSGHGWMVKREWYQRFKSKRKARKK
jgi:hypothetical protein